MLIAGSCTETSTHGERNCNPLLGALRPFSACSCSAHHGKILSGELQATSRYTPFLASLVAQIFYRHESSAKICIGMKDGQSSQFASASVKPKGTCARRRRSAPSCAEKGPASDPSRVKCTICGMFYHIAGIARHNRNRHGQHSMQPSRMHHVKCNVCGSLVHPAGLARHQVSESCALLRKRRKSDF